MDMDIFIDAFQSPKVDFILSHAMYSRDILKLKKGQRAVISNGRVSIMDPKEERGSDSQSDTYVTCFTLYA